MKVASPDPTVAQSTNTLKLFFNTGRTILGFIIPRDFFVGLEPKLVTQMDCEANYGNTSSLGFNGAIIHGGGP